VTPPFRNRNVMLNRVSRSRPLKSHADRGPGDSPLMMEGNGDEQAPARSLRSAWSWKERFRTPGGARLPAMPGPLSSISMAAFPRRRAGGGEPKILGANPGARPDRAIALRRVS